MCLPSLAFLPHSENSELMSMYVPGLVSSSCGQTFFFSSIASGYRNLCDPDFANSLDLRNPDLAESSIPVAFFAHSRDNIALACQGVNIPGAPK